MEYVLYVIKIHQKIIIIEKIIELKHAGDVCIHL